MSCGSSFAFLLVFYVRQNGFGVFGEWKSVCRVGIEVFIGEIVKDCVKNRN